ncbi:NACHT domain-containing protein [Burkholderia cenocepacia]
MSGSKGHCERADVVLVTVNKHEYEELLAALKMVTGKDGEKIQGESNEIYSFSGVINGQRVYVARSLMGSTGSGASIDTVLNITSDLAPKVLICVGIAWGAKNGQGQEIGDVLLSTRLRDAQHHKSTDGHIIPRGDLQSVDGTLLKTFISAAHDSGVRVHDGLLVSIETLFDDEAARNRFIAMDDGQPIGGEMEASGVLFSLRRATGTPVRWIVVKGICDWGFKKNVDAAQKERDQALAARHAAKLCVETLKRYRLVNVEQETIGPETSLADNQPSLTSSPGLATTHIAVPRERSIDKTVQLYISKNSSYSLDLGFPVIHKNWDENIFFELYRLTEELGNSRYFLYVHESASQQKTFDHLKRAGHLSPGIPLVVLTEKPAALKDSDRRKENLKQIFSTANVFFIDEFGRQYLYKEHISEYRPYNLAVYVENVTDSSVNGETQSALSSLKAWYSSISAPLMVVRGYGGLGKTTLVKRFLDDVHAENKETGILFIDSNEIIGELETITRVRQKIDDIYDFYQAQVVNLTDAKNFSKDLLSLSVDNGSLLIVLDGIDEVIAKLGAKFDAVNFIKSISTIYSANLQRAKIIITCRDYFWNSLQNAGSVQTIDLQPFTERMAQEFFLKSLHNVPAKVENALQIANRLAMSPGSNKSDVVYVPYILDIIVYLIEHKVEFSDEPLRLPDVGGLLHADFSNDFLVASVCEREIRKLHSLPVERQLQFFIRLSVAKDGHVSSYDVKDLLNKNPSQEESFGDDAIERLQGHPLLVTVGNKIMFRYDFFTDYFRALYLYSYFSSKELSALNKDVIEVSASYLRFDSEFMRDLCRRLSLDEDLLIFGMDTVSNIQTSSASLDSKGAYLAQRACSSIFCMFLALLRDSPDQTFDVEGCTNLLKHFFEDGGEIRKLSLINVSSTTAARPIFDFRSLTLRDCYFERYEFFWDCPIDDETRFFSGTFRSLEPRKDVRPRFFENTFDEKSCDLTGISHLLSQEKEATSQAASETRANLIRIFRLFYVRGNFYPQKQEYIRSKVFTGAYLPLLLKNRVIEEYSDSEKGTLRQYRVHPSYHGLIKHLEQGGASIELDRLTKLFKK